MMVRIGLPVLLFTLGATAVSTASGQSLLERLERRLNQGGIRVGPAPESEALPPPAQPRPAGEPSGYLGLVADERNGAVEVVSVRAGGPADEAGVRPGDRIVSIGGVEINKLDDMAAITGTLPAGAQIELVVSRAGRRQTVAVVAGERPRDPEAGPRGEPPLPVERAQLGVRAAPVTAEAQQRYGLTVRRGAVIIDIEPGSPADTYRLPLGGAIVAVDGEAIDSPEALARVVATRTPGETVEITYYQRGDVFRKRVRLSPAAGDTALPGERPILRRLERALDTVTQPPPGSVEQIRALEVQLLRMQEELELLQVRVKELEARLEGKPAETTPPQPQAEVELEPPIKPLEP